MHIAHTLRQHTVRLITIPCTESFAFLGNACTQWFIPIFKSPLPPSYIFLTVSTTIHLNLLYLSSLPIFSLYPMLSPSNTLLTSLPHFCFLRLISVAERGGGGGGGGHPEVCSITPAAGSLLGRLMERSMSPDRLAAALASPVKSFN